eukprot:CAMPEP_0117537852 /NCGR_PEP_ID=MMETSP0784-20121206/42181_1 /TAXON_ID=39447 /ORGANISM="" /LENGTH=167 /DNA_ID=CAMNT_0005334457 /DNA_START=190 /DNA_END=693 /DNA_ORIENTATION=-
MSSSPTAGGKKLHSHVLHSSGSDRVRWPELAWPVHVLDERRLRGAQVVRELVHDAREVKIPVLVPRQHPLVENASCLRRRQHALNEAVVVGRVFFCQEHDLLGILLELLCPGKRGLNTLLHHERVQHVLHHRPLLHGGRDLPEVGPAAFRPRAARDESRRRHPPHRA